MSLVLDRPVEVMLSIYEALLESPSEYAEMQAASFTAQEFLRSCAGATVVGFDVRGELGGGMFFRHDRVHVGVKSKYRQLWCRRYFRKMMEIGFARNGSPLKALVSEGNKVAQRFTEKVGGDRIGTQGASIYYLVRQGEMRYPC